MLEYQGKYGKAKVMIDNIDSTTVSQIYDFLNHKAFTNPIAIMPDTHAGAGAVIGFTMPMTDKIIPNVVGVDIGCGMLSLMMNESVKKHATLDMIDQKIREEIPFGKNVRSDPYLDEFSKILKATSRDFTMKFNSRFGKSYSPILFNKEWFIDKAEQIDMDYTRALNSIGTLGGGNHFIEVGVSEITGRTMITIHSGSRQFGLKIAKYWQKKAGRGALAYLEGDDMFGYLTDMFFAQMYAHANRKTMARIIKNMFGDCNWEITTVHNYIDFQDFIIRKGAIRAYKSDLMVIPFNMEDGILLCKGKSNSEWNFSAPHGAGRVGSRAWAKKNLNHEEARKRMKDMGIYTSVIPKDELKGAYKDPKIIEDAIEPTAEIVDRFKPILNMKASN